MKNPRQCLRSWRGCKVRQVQTDYAVAMINLMTQDLRALEKSDTLPRWLWIATLATRGERRQDSGA